MMRTAILVLCLVASAASVAAPPDTLAEQAAAAKAAGKSEITMFTIAEPVRVESLEDALARYDIAVARVTGRITRVEDERRIETWYRLRLDELLTERSAVATAPPSTEITSNDYPQELQPLGPWEVLVRISGGRVEIDGVEFRVGVEPWTPLEPGGEYLVFLKLPPDHRMARLPLVGHGVFRVDDGDALEPVLDATRQHIVWRELAGRYRASLERFRRAVQSR